MVLYEWNEELDEVDERLLGHFGIVQFRLDWQRWKRRRQQRWLVSDPSNKRAINHILGTQNVTCLEWIFQIRFDQPDTHDCGTLRAA
jgi:hypothetical protein